MKPTVVIYAASILLVLSGGAEAAAAKSSCLLFCGGSSTPESAPAPAKTSAPIPEATPSYDVETAIGQAMTARKAGDYAGAARILSQLVLFVPDDAHVLGEYGKTLAAQGRSDDALAFLDRAIQLIPDDWSLYSAQGIAYDQKGAYTAAQGSYSRALALKPGDPSVLNNSALSHMQLGDLESAKALLEQAAPAASVFPRITDNLALVQRLIESRPQPALAIAQPAPVAHPTPAAPPTPVAAAEVAPLTLVVETPLPAPVPVASSEPTSDPSASPAASTSAYAALGADSTVRMAPIPQEEAPRPAPTPASSKPAQETRVADAAIQSSTAKASPPGSASTYYVQAGAYASEQRAGELAHSLDSMGARVSPATIGGRAMYRVRIGPFLDVDQASAAISQAQSIGQGDLRIVSE